MSAKQKYSRGLKTVNQKLYEAIQKAIQILKETAEEFRNLDREAELCLVAEDAGHAQEKYEKRTQLIIDLPDRLIPLLKEVGTEEIQSELWLIQSFSERAKKLLENKSYFAMSALLTHMGSKPGEDNDLEKLIKRIEKYVKR